jgi:hypothetical protein
MKPTLLDPEMDPTEYVSCLYLMTEADVFNQKNGTVENAQNMC